MTSSKKGRPLKGDEPRKAVTFRITPTAADAIARAADELGCSQSDIVEDYAMMLNERIGLKWPIPDWGDRKSDEKN